MKRTLRYVGALLYPFAAYAAYLGLFRGMSSFAAGASPNLNFAILLTTYVVLGILCAIPALALGRASARGRSFHPALLTAGLVLLVLILAYNLWKNRMGMGGLYASGLDTVLRFLDWDRTQFLCGFLMALAFLPLRQGEGRAFFARLCCALGILVVAGSIVETIAKNVMAEGALRSAILSLGYAQYLLIGYVAWISVRTAASGPLRAPRWFAAGLWAVGALLAVACIAKFALPPWVNLHHLPLGAYFSLSAHPGYAVALSSLAGSYLCLLYKTVRCEKNKGVEPNEGDKSDR